MSEVAGSANKSEPPLIVITGATASGKSSVALSLAEVVGGEIICADSRTIYRYMDIGTAKPSQEDQAKTPHHLLGIIDPSQKFSAADFQRLASAAIVEITERGKLPIIVGGTGLYIDSLLFDFSFAGNADPKLRKRLELMSLDELQTEILERDLPIPHNENNPRHLISMIERGGVASQRSALRPNTIVIGKWLERDVLKKRIYNRVDSMLALGLEEEVMQLSREYNWDSPGMLTIGYREWRPFFDNTATLEQTKLAIQKATWQYARRQLTWFRRNSAINWTGSSEQIIDLAKSFLNKNSA